MEYQTQKNHAIVKGSTHHIAENKVYKLNFNHLSAGLRKV
jgi:hypothetical protein